MKWLLDTNIALYHVGGSLLDPVPPGEHFQSVMSELEMLSWPQLEPAAEEGIRRFIDALAVVELTPEIKKQAVEIRRTHRLHLPDAIIAASARVLDAVLLTADRRLLSVLGAAARELRFAS